MGLESSAVTKFKRDEDMLIETTLDEMRTDSNWKEAFGFSGGDVDEVSDVLASVDGEKDGVNWVALFKLKDGSYAVLDAGCDYTGWDCEGWGEYRISPTFDHAVRFGLTEDARYRLDIELVD